MHLLLHPLFDHLFRAAPARTGQTRRGAKQAADQRALVVDFAALGTEVHAVEFGQRGFVGGIAFHRQAGHFLGGGGDRAATIVTAGYAVEAGDLPAQVIDLAIGATHGSGPEEIPRMVAGQGVFPSTPLANSATRAYPA